MFCPDCSFLELGRPLCFGEAYCFTGRPSYSCYLSPERQNCQHWEPDELCFSPTSHLPSPRHHLGRPEEGDQCDTKCSQEDEDFSTHQGQPRSLLEPPTKGRTIRVVCMEVCTLISFPPSSSLLFLPFHQPSLPLSLPQESAG